MTATAAAHCREASLVCEKLDELMMGGLAGCFARVEPRQQARKSVAALISELPRKNGWMLAEQAGGTEHRIGCSGCCSERPGAHSRHGWEAEPATLQHTVEVDRAQRSRTKGAGNRGKVTQVRRGQVIVHGGGGEPPDLVAGEISVAKAAHVR